MPRYNANFTSDSEKKKYLFCDGSTYNTSVYPKLYKILGTNRLPNVNNRVLWGSSTGGTYINAGLPNITGTFTHINFVDPTGAFQNTGFCNWTAATGGGVGDSTNHVLFDASRANSIYGNSNTVQPPAMTVRFYIRAK